jgi:hypothetical protein
MASRGNGRESIVSVRLSDKEEAEIKSAAERRGEPVSTFLRDAALSAARPTRTPYGPSWTSSPATVAAGGTVIERYAGTVGSSRPPRVAGTSATQTEPITRSE